MARSAGSRPGRGRAIAVLAVAASLGMAGCSSADPSASAHPKAQATTSTSTTVAPTTTSTTEQPGWTPVSMVGGAVAVDSRSVTETTGHQVILFRFRAGRVHFGLHVGSQDPPRGAATVSADDGPSIGPGEAPSLVAAFNGGFKANAGAGGFELNGQVLIPLQPGYASLIIDAGGSARVGVWGSAVPATGEQVASVRQNLPPLVVDGQPSPGVNDVAAWGATLSGAAALARSALGEDAAGNLVYAASMDALPADLANALIAAGAVTGMELDVNPQWVQLAWSATPGGTLTAGVPGQSRPADQYQVGWTRDFVTVMASG